MASTPDLFLHLLGRELAGRYARSLAGAAWALLQPLAQLLLFSVVFSVILRVPLVGERGSSFPIFLFAGLLPWLGFQEGLVRGSQALVEQAELLKRHPISLGPLVAVRVAAALVLQLAGLSAFAILLVWRQELCWGCLFWAPLGLLLQGLLAYGLAGALAPVQVLYRDTSQLLGVLLPAWFYATPIVYPIALVPEPLRDWLWLHPLTPIVALYRAGLFGSPPPPGFALGGAILLTAAIALVGHRALVRARAWIADEV